MEEIEVINGLKLKAHFLEDGANLVEQYFDLDQYKGEWHEAKRNVYHLTVLLACLKQSFRNIKYEYTGTLESRGSWCMGDIIHFHGEEHKLKIDGYYVKEFPLNVDVELKGDEFELKITVKDETIYIVGKIDLLHTIEHRIEDLKSYSEWFIPKKIEDVDIKYVRQLVLYAFILNHTYLEREPIETLYLVCVSKKNLFTKVVSIEYDDKVGLELWNWIVNRAKRLHIALHTDTEPEGEPDKFCQYGQYIEDCVEGREFLKDVLPPVSLESRLFAQRYPDKKAYWKFDKEKGEWIETKLFKAFKIELEKQKGDKK